MCPGPRFASVALVDPRGRLLLQERDEHPVIDPERWGFPGGGVEPGETPEQAAYRELAEETGVRLTEGLEQVAVLSFFHAHTGTHDEFRLYAAATDLDDADIVCGEGRQMVFVQPEVARGLPLTGSAAQALPAFLDGATYRRLRDRPARRATGHRVLFAPGGTMSRGMLLRRAAAMSAVAGVLAAGAGCGAAGAPEPGAPGAVDPAGGETRGAAGAQAPPSDAALEGAAPAPADGADPADPADPAAQPLPAGLDPALAVDPPGPLTGRLRSADLLVYAPERLSAETRAQVRALEGVTTMLSVSLSQVQVEGKALNVLAVDPRTYRPYTRRESAELQEVWDRLARGEAAVPPDVDANLLDEAGFLKLGSAADSPSAHVGAFAPQVPFVDAVVNEKVGAAIGMTPGNALLISTGINAPAAVQGPVAEIVGGNVSVQALDVVAQLGLDIDAQQTAFLIGSVGETVGTYRYTVEAGGRVLPDPDWEQSRISTRVVPILGRVTCNAALFPQLDAALREVVERGLADEINPGEYAGCYYPRFIANSNRLSNHAFGLALDLNVPGNGRGTVGEMDRGVVSIFKKWGFAWGGDWGYTDPMHFEMAALVDPR